MKRLIVLLLTIMLVAPATLMAATNVELEKMILELQEELEDLNDRTDVAEFHATTDRLRITGDFRNRMHSLHYQDTTWAPGVAIDINKFAADSGAGNFGTGAPGTPLGDFMATYPLFTSAFMGGQLGPFAGFSIVQPNPPTSVTDYGQIPFAIKDIDNDIAYNTRLRLNLMAKVWDNVSFSGRLSMYKNWGDSTGVQVFDSWNAFTMDGSMGGNTTGNTIQVERAFFNWKNIGGSNFWFSVGRRPSTYGAPNNYRENEMRGGSPSGHLVHFNFDGMTIGYAPENGPEGMKIRFCYGQGFESLVGNGELFGNIMTDDTHLGGFAIDAYDDGSTLVQVMAFAALDVVDGFKGTFAFPTEFAQFFAPTMFQDLQNFPNMNFVTRYTPSTNIGDMYLGGLSVSREEENGLKYFGSLGWTQLDPNGKAGMFGGMGGDHRYEVALVDSNGDGLPTDGEQLMPMPTGTNTLTSAEDGYGVYVGVQIPTGNGKLGLEYNYGSEYWTPFTQAQDDALGSKLAVRGQVGEGYYIWDVNPNMFIKLAGLFYDYEYTGSGSPVGAPQKVEDVLNGTAVSMMPVVDTAWDANVSLTIKF